MKAVCPYCRMEVDSPVSCPSCATPHHPECWEENRGCTVFGCSEGPPEEPKINLDDSPPPPLPGHFPTPPLFPGTGHPKYTVPGERYSEVVARATFTLADQVYGFFECNPRAWDYLLAGLWGTAVGSLAGSILGFVSGLCAAMFAGQFRAILVYPINCLLFGQALAVAAALLALFFTGEKFAAFLRTFSQAFVRAILPDTASDDRDAQ